MLTAIDSPPALKPPPNSSQATQHQQRLLPSTLSHLIYRLGKELTCAICLGIFGAAPVMTPCLHLFCGPCVERMLRIGRRSDGPCPICKLRVSRRTLVSIPMVAILAHAFEELSDAYFQFTGHRWDTLNPDPEIDSKTGLSPIIQLYSLTESDPDPEELKELKAEEVRLLTELDQINSKLQTHPSRPITTPNLGALNELELPSSPAEDLFCPNFGSSITVEILPVTYSTNTKFVLCTSMVRDPHLRQRIRQFAQHYKMTLQDSFDENVTHLIMATTKSHYAIADPTSASLITGSPLSVYSSSLTQSNTISSPQFGGGVTKRSLKYLLAILYGCWIINVEWTLSLSHPKPLAEEQFEVQGDESFPYEATPHRARLSRQAAKMEALLTGYSFYLYGEFKAPSRFELIQLIKAAGANLIKDSNQLSTNPTRRQKGNTTERAGSSSTVLALCDSQTRKVFETDTGIVARFKPLLSVTWLLDCISAYQIIDIRSYVIL